MMKVRTLQSMAVIAGMMIGVMASGVQVQEEDAQAAMKKDKTGTNPVNFAPELRLYNEFQWLNTAGDGEQNITTLEGRMPLLDGKFQLRARVRYASIKADINDDGIDDLDESGIGDADFRLLTVPVMDMPNMRAMAIGLETFLNTADEDALGAGTTSLGPQVFFVKFFKRGLFAPGFQYKFSVDEDEGRADTDQILIDLNLLIMAKDKLAWFFTDPQIVIDNENDKEFAIVDLEFGAMMQKWFPNLKGQSAYIRPSFGLGTDRPVDGSVEAGYKFVF